MHLSSYRVLPFFALWASLIPVVSASESGEDCAKYTISLSSGDVYSGDFVMKSPEVMVFRTCEGATISFAPTELAEVAQGATRPTAAPVSAVPVNDVLAEPASQDEPPVESGLEEEASYDFSFEEEEDSFEYDPPAAVQEAQSMARDHSAEQPVEVVESEAVNRGGLSVQGGYGYQFAGLGGGLFLYNQPSRGAFTIYFGGGYLPGIGGASGWGVSGGVMLARGLNHRLVLDANVGLAAWVEQYYYYDDGTTQYSKNSVYGFTGAAGYEYMGDRGFVFRATGGVTFAFDYTPLGDIIPTINLAFGKRG